MTLVVGLGNPGDRYRDTRHNVGFGVLDLLASSAGAGVWISKYRGLICLANLEGHGVPLLKPQTYMNLSGNSVSTAASMLKQAPAELLVVHDELDLPFGQVRLKLGGGVAGHNGLKSVSEALGSSDYGRVRIGVGRPGGDFSGSIADYVLEAFASEELRLLPDVLRRGAEAVRLVIRLGLAQAMNQVNQKAKTQPTS